MVERSRLWVTVAMIPLKNRLLMISELSTPSFSASSCTVRLPSGTISISGRTALASREDRSSMARRRWRWRVVSFLRLRIAAIGLAAGAAAVRGLAGRARLACRMKASCSPA